MTDIRIAPAHFSFLVISITYGESIYCEIGCTGKRRPAGHQHNPPGIGFLGKKTWTPGKNLGKFIAGRFGISAREQAVILESITEAVRETVPIVLKTMEEHPGFRDIGKRMLLAWQEGVTGLRDRRVYAVGDWETSDVFEGISDPPKLQSAQRVIDRSPLLGNRSTRPNRT